MTADTFSPSCGAIEQGTGNNNNSWGTNLNEALTALDLGISGFAGFAVTGGNLALDGVVPPAGQHPLVQMIVAFNGTLASNQTVTIPNVSKMWLVTNNTTGAFTLQFKTTTGTAGAAIPQGGAAFVACDGSNNIFVGLSSALQTVQWLGAAGTLALPGISFAVEPGTGLWRKSTGILSLVIGGVEIAEVSATGINVLTGNLTVSGVAIVPPGTEVDFAGINAPTGWYLEFGQTVARAGDPNLLAALTQAFTATTNGTTTLSSVSVNLTGLGLEGSKLEGVGMATGATIVSIAATSIVMSIAATNSVAGGTVTAFPYGNGDGATTFGLPDGRGAVYAGRDNMGGTAANRLTTAGSGVNGLQLNTLSGNQTINNGAGINRSDLPNASIALAGTSGTVSVTSTTANIVVGLLVGGISSGGGGFQGISSGSSVTPSSQGSFTPQGNTLLNGGVTQTLAVVVQPTAIRNKLIKR